MLLAVLERLQEHAPGLASVDIGEDLDAIVAGTAPGTGDTFVIPARERADPNRLAMGGFRQRVTEQFYVAFFISYHGDVHGRARAERFDGFKTAIEDALAGWQPSPDSEPFALVNGEGTPLGNNLSVYVQAWQTTRTLSGKDP